MLKRSGYIRRYTPLSTRAKTALANVRKSKASAVRKANAERAAFVREVGSCQCGCGKLAEVTHEIARGAARGQAIFHRAAWLALSEACHGLLHRENWPIAFQLWLKRSYDFEHYDRVLVNRLRGRAADAITEEEVDDAVGQFIF